MDKFLGRKLPPGQVPGWTTSPRTTPWTSSRWTSTHMDKFLGGQLPPGQVPDQTYSTRTSSWPDLLPQLTYIPKMLAVFYPICPYGYLSTRNLSGGKLSHLELVRGEVVPPGICPYGYLSRGNLSGGKLSRGKLSVSRRRLADNFPLVCLERGKQQQQSNKWKKNYSILEV